MENNTGRTRGRPPAAPPTMPIFLGAARSRVKMDVVMSGHTSRELKQYVDWASGVAMMPDDEVLIRVLDHALTECFRADKAWQRDKAEYLATAAAPQRQLGSNKHEGAAAPATVAGDKAVDRASTGVGGTAAGKGA